MREVLSFLVLISSMCFTNVVLPSLLKLIQLLTKTLFPLFLDSNIANIGSDMDKKIRQAAAQTEPAWANAGRAPGLQIWRIEKFQVKSIAKEDYGKRETCTSFRL